MNFSMEHFLATGILEPEQINAFTLRMYCAVLLNEFLY